MFFDNVDVVNERFREVILFIRVVRLRRARKSA